jgi:hypothetical protein
MPERRLEPASLSRFAGQSCIGHASTRVGYPSARLVTPRHASGSGRSASHRQGLPLRVRGGRPLCANSGRSLAARRTHQKRSSESEDYASKVRATPLAWLRGRIWVGEVQLACRAFRSMAAFPPRRRKNPEARPARPQRRGPSRPDTAPTDRPAMGRHRGPDWPPADCWHRGGRGTQGSRRSRKTRRGCRA